MLDHPLPQDQIQDLDNRHYLHPWQSLSTEPPNRLVMARGEGIHVFDGQGRRLIDGPGGMWAVQIGYARQEMADAIAAQVMELCFHSPWAFTSDPAARLAGKLAELAPGDLKSVFFTTGGSTAVDSAIRLVHFHNNILGKPDKKLIIARAKGYHGSTYLSATVSGKERDMVGLDIERRLVRLLGNVNPYIRPEGMSVEAWCDAKVEELEQTILEAGPDKVAAFIAEPVLCSGGVIVPPPGYHRRTWEICRKYDVIYISDEVVTAFGRLGHWFASEAVFGITPDIITCAKGLTSGYLPLGAMLVSDRLFDRLRDDRRSHMMFSNGFTYSGHPVSCAAALKNIEIMEREDLCGHVRRISPQFQERLARLARFDIIGDARGVGLLGCIEGRSDRSLDEESRKRIEMDYDFGGRVDRACERRGLIVRPLINMCVFSPPLIITPAQIDEMFDILEDALSAVQAGSE